jgi:hypothetical protein
MPDDICDRHTVHLGDDIARHQRLLHILLLGQYFFLLQAVTDFNFAVLGLYAVGAVIGLKLLAKVLDYLFQKFHDGMMAFLTGLVIGSLYVTWPFKNMYVVGGETLYLSNTLPKSFAQNEWLTLGTALLGVVIVVFVILLNRVYGKRSRQAQRKADESGCFLCMLIGARTARVRWFPRYEKPWNCSNSKAFVAYNAMLFLFPL